MTTPARSGFRESTYGPAITKSGRGPRRGLPRPASSSALRTASAAPARVRRNPTGRTGAAGSARGVTPALQRELAIEGEEPDPLDLRGTLHELVAPQRRAEHPAVRPGGRTPHPA